MQANIEQIQKDNILNKFMYFNDEEDELRYNLYYLNQHSKMMYLVNIIVFGVNMSVISKILSESGINEVELIPIFINQVLVLIMLLCIWKKSSIYNKLSCLINIIFAVEVYYYQKRFKSTDLNDYYQLCGFIIYGSHSSLMLSSQLFYDSLGFIINFSIYTYQLYRNERVIEILLMWCIIIISIFQKFQHHKFTRFLYVSMQHQQEWIDVIENVLPSAIISIQQGKHSSKSHHQNKLDQTTQPNIQGLKDKINNQQNIQNQNSNGAPFQKQMQQKQNSKKIQQKSLPFQSLPNAPVSGTNQMASLHAAVDASNGLPPFGDYNENLFDGWNLNLVNDQSKEMYNIRNMETFVSFANNVLIETKELMMETSSAVNGNILSPLHPLDGKQIDMSHTTNQLNFTINPQNAQGIKINNSQNNISGQLNNFQNSNNKEGIQQPKRYSLKGHTQNNIVDVFTNQQLKNQKTLKNNEKMNTMALIENNIQVNHQGQVCSGVLSLQADGGSVSLTLYKQLQTLFEEYNCSTRKPKFFIWKLNGKYYPPIQEKGDRGSIMKEKENSHLSNKNNNNSKERSNAPVSIQIKVCGFRGKQTRIVLCIDDISISEKIQLYQSQDKYKDLVLANAAHDLRQPLNTLNYTILEAKKLLNKFQSQNIYSFLYKFYPQQFSMLTQVNPILNGMLPNLSASRMNLTDFIAILINNYKILNVNPTLVEDCTDIQMIADLLEMADISGSSLKYLINDILDHAKLKEGKLQVNFKECSLSQIIQFTKKMFDFSFKERGIKYRIINQSNLTSDTICTDQQRLQQVLVNLLSNSMKFTSSNKYIILHITKVIKNVNNREVSLLKISVIDQGCGMSSEQLEQIFKPYVSFNNNNLNIEGIGLGLNICKSIIGLLGPYPKLYVRSKQDEGTKFFFYVYHQLRKGSSTYRPGQNKTWSKIPQLSKYEQNSYTINTLFQGVKFLQYIQKFLSQFFILTKFISEIKNKNNILSFILKLNKIKLYNQLLNGKSKNNEESEQQETNKKNVLQKAITPSSTQKVEDGDQDNITTKGVLGQKEQQSKKNLESIELNEFNEVVEKKRAISIIDNTLRSNNDQSENQIQTDNLVTTNKNSMIFHKQTSFQTEDQIIKNNQDQLNKNKREKENNNILNENNNKKKITLDLIQKSIELEDSQNNIEEQSNKDEDEDKNSNLNLTSIIMQLPDLYEDGFDVETYSPLSKQSKYGILSKYFMTGQLINPITSLNSQRASCFKHTPRSENNITLLENTFQQQNISYQNDETSYNPHSTNNLRDIGEIFQQKRGSRNIGDSKTQINNNTSYNNIQVSDSYLLNRKNSFGLEIGQGINNFNKNIPNSFISSKQNSPQVNNNRILLNQDQLQSDSSQSNLINTNMSQYSFNNQYQIKQSQFINNNINLKEDQQLLQNYSGNRQNYPNSIDSLYSTKVQSLKHANSNQINSAFQPVGSSQLINGSNKIQQRAGMTKNFSNTHISNNNTKSINNSMSINNSGNNNSSNNLMMNKKRLNKNLPAIITQFQKKYPNALNEMEQSTGSFIIGQKEELQVLIADDDPFNISILKMMLKKSDQFTFSIKECHNGRESLTEFQKRNKPTSIKPFALIISDVNMPIMDGIESTKQMRKAILEQNFHEATFIGITGIDEEQIANDQDLYQDFKIFDVTLSKPLKEQAIINAINQNFLDFY